MICISKKWLNHPVKVDFLDHSENVGSVVPISVYGVLHKITRTQITIRSWDAGDINADTDNCHTDFFLVRSAITRFTPLMSARRFLAEK